jgi:hypothetical protein
MARLDILDEIEQKADKKSLVGFISSALLNVAGVYVAIEVSTYIWRGLTGH